jgi:hypothetical protein
MEANSIHPPFLNLLQETVSEISAEDVLTIVSERRRDPEAGFDLFVETDKKIPGKGLHNVVKPVENGCLALSCDAKDRPIFSPVQEILAHCSQLYSEWDTRYVVDLSCQHLEACLRRYCHYEGKMAYGKLLHSELGEMLPENLSAQLEAVRVLLYVKSKENKSGRNESYFSQPDAIASYFICRALGMKLY